jgi:hypothetical protein
LPGKQGMEVREYLKQLRATRKGKPPQIREALDIYIDLWDKAVESGTVAEGDEIGAALSKIDKAGGLYRVSDK